MLATPSSGLSTKILAQSQFSSFFAQGHAFPPAWGALMAAYGQTDVYVVDNKIDPGGTTGWHTHPGPSLILVVSGQVTNYTTEDRNCAGHTYTAGQGFIDGGGNDEHTLRNNGTTRSRNHRRAAHPPRRTAQDRRADEPHTLSRVTPPFRSTAAAPNDPVNRSRSPRTNDRRDPQKTDSLARGGTDMKGLQIKHLRAYGLGAAITAACAALVLLPVQPAAATVRLGQPTTDGGNFPSLSAIEPGRHPALHISTPVNIVFVGYRPDTVDVGRILSQLPSGADPRVRSDGFGLPGLTGPGQDVGLRYDYRYSVRFAGRAFDDAFFAYLTSIAVVGAIDPIMELYNEQQHNRLDVGPQEAYIDANATEAWLETQSARRLGIAADQDTVFLVDWYGRPDFQFHTYYHLGNVDPDTGIDGGGFVGALTRAWGGNSGPTWFYDLSAGPDYGDNSWDVDDADLDGDGVLDYRMPPIWEYGNTTAYRPFNDLSGDLAKEIRYVALDMLFTPSPIFDPAATVPGPDGAKQIALDIFEGDPDRNGLGDVHPDVVQSTAQSLEPYYPVTFGVTDRPLAGGVLDAYNISIGRSDAPGCPDFQQFQSLGYADAELSCFFRENRAEYFPAPAGNAVIPAIGFTVPDEDAVQAFGLTGATEPDFQTGLPTFIYELDTPDEPGLSRRRVHRDQHPRGRSLRRALASP